MAGYHEKWTSSGKKLIIDSKTSKKPRIIYAFFNTKTIHQCKII